jgi:hypothetical protein
MLGRMSLIQQVLFHVLPVTLHVCINRPILSPASPEGGAAILWPIDDGLPTRFHVLTRACTPGCVLQCTACPTILDGVFPITALGLNLIETTPLFSSIVYRRHFRGISVLSTVPLPPWRPLNACHLCLSRLASRRANCDDHDNDNTASCSLSLHASVIAPSETARPVTNGQLAAPQTSQSHSLDAPRAPYLSAFRGSHSLRRLVRPIYDACQPRPADQPTNAKSITTNSYHHHCHHTLLTVEDTHLHLLHIGSSLATEFSICLRRAQIHAARSMSKLSRQS